MWHGWGEPFHAGSAGNTPDAGAFDIELGGRGFLLDMTDNMFSKRSVDVLKTVTNADAGETSLLEPEVWRRRQTSWHLGAGQTHRDRDESLPARYRASMGIDPWTIGELRLLPDVAEVAAATGQVRLAIAGGHLVLWSSDEPKDLVFFDGLDDASPVTVSVTDDVVDFATHGTGLFALTTAGAVLDVDPGGASSFASVPGATMLRYVKGKLLAAAGDYLYDVTTGSAELVVQSTIPGYTWVDACEGLGAIYLLGGGGDRWEVVKCTIDDDAVTLLPPSTAAMLPDGERGYALGSYLGYVLVGTSAGVRFGAAGGNADLTLGAPVPTPAPVRCFEGQERFVWFGLTDYTPERTGLGRLSLVDFTSVLTPAWAPDLMVDGQGAVRSVVTYGGKQVFAVDNAGVFAAHDTELVESGWLDIGKVTFGVPDRKVALRTSVLHEPLAGRVEVAETYDGDVEKVVGVSAVPGSTSSPEFALDGKRYRHVTPRLVLERDPLDPSRGPVVTGWETRARGVPGNAVEWRLPIKLADDLYLGDGQSTVPRSPADDAAFLEELVATGRTVQLRDRVGSHVVTCEDFAFYRHRRAADGKGWHGIVMVTARSVR